MRPLDVRRIRSTQAIIGGVADENNSDDGSSSSDSVEVYPTRRFTPWSQTAAETREGAAAALGYLSERSWDFVGSNRIELLSYETILNHSAAQAAAIDHLMNETTVEDSWDCYLNHYEDYSWSELDLYGIQ